MKGKNSSLPSKRLQDLGKTNKRNYILYSDSELF